MAQVESVDWTGKIIYLHADTAANGLDGIAAHFELKAIAGSNATSSQNFGIPSEAEGNLPKGGGKFTPRFLFLYSGWVLVPYGGGVDYVLRLLTEIISEDGKSDRDVFDRSSLAVKVDIDSVYDQVEIIEIATGGSSLDIDTKLDEIIAMVHETARNTQPLEES